MSQEATPGAESNQTQPEAAGSVGSAEGTHSTGGNAASKGSESTSSQSSEDPNESSWDDRTKSYISGLRKESANYRTRAKNLEDQLGSVTEQLGSIKQALGLEEQPLNQDTFNALQQQNDDMVFRNAVLETAVEFGIPRDGLDYFSYLMQNQLSGLQEGQELTEDDINEIAQQAISTVGNRTGKTSVENFGEGQQAKDPQVGESVSLDQFVSMSTTEKSDLYANDPELYEKLMKEARAANRIV